MSRRFEGAQRLRDGAFIAALLEAPDVTVGGLWWEHLSSDSVLPEEPEAAPDDDPREEEGAQFLKYFRPVLVAEVQPDKFSVRELPPHVSVMPPVNARDVANPHLWTLASTAGSSAVNGGTASSAPNDNPAPSQTARRGQGQGQGRLSLMLSSNRHTSARGSAGGGIALVSIKSSMNIIRDHGHVDLKNPMYAEGGQREGPRRSTPNTTPIIRWVELEQSEGAGSLLRKGVSMLRCIEWEQFKGMMKLFEGGFQGFTAEAAHKIKRFAYSKSRPVKAGEKIDFFVSHAWKDSAEMKEAKVAEVVRSFVSKHGRTPTFWVDCACFDQDKLQDCLKVLPVNVSACRQVLSLCGANYFQRLWCVWELYTVFAFNEKPLEKVNLQFLTEQIQKDTHINLSRFQLRDAHCYDPNQESKLRRVIADSGGDCTFETHIRELGTKLLARGMQ